MAFLALVSEVVLAGALEAVEAGAFPAVEAGLAGMFGKRWVRREKGFEGVFDGESERIG